MGKDYAQQEAIREAALDLEVDEAMHMACPFCNASHEMSMRVVRTDGGISAKCWRAKCGKYSFIPSIPPAGVQSHLTGKKKFEPRYFREDLVSLPLDVAAYLHDMYELSLDELNRAGIKYSPPRNCLYMPILDIRGYPIGGQTKSLDKSARFKAISYFHTTAVKAHFAFGTLPATGRTIVLVEDILSSTKVARLLPACALLSHGLTEEVAHHLATHFRNVVVMLDPDAAQKAIQMRTKYSLLFRNFSIIMLSKDPKDLPWTDLRHRLTTFVEA